MRKYIYIYIYTDTRIISWLLLVVLVVSTIIIIKLSSLIIVFWCFESGSATESKWTKSDVGANRTRTNTQLRGSFLRQLKLLDFLIQPVKIPHSTIVDCKKNYLLDTGSLYCIVS